VDKKDQNGLGERAISFQPERAEPISSASADNIGSQAVRPTPDQPAPQGPKAAERSQALDSNASGSLFLVSDMSVSAEGGNFVEPRKQRERRVTPISRADLSKSGTTMEHLHKMSVGNLEVLDALSNEGRQIIKTRLMVIWDEMSVRFERGESINGISGTGGKGMGKYLRSIGVSPAKRRSWKFEIHREETLRLAHENPPTKRTPKKKAIVINSETEADLIAKAGVKVAQLLADASMTPQEGYNKAVAVANDILRAVEGGQYEALEPLPHSENASDSHNCESTSKPERSSLEELRQWISLMADTDDIQHAVQKYVNELFAPLREEGLVLMFQVSARREGRERVDSGDWVELTSRGGTDKQLGRVVDRDKLCRPRIRWFEDGGWQVPRSLFANSGDHPHVLSATEAQDNYPDAFACYCQSGQSRAATTTPTPPEGL
jgi:hypothetical protein